MVEKETMKISNLMAYELIEKIKNKEIKIEEIIQQVYERIRC